MAETVLGTVGVVWGLGTEATGTGIGAFQPQSSDFSRDADSVQVRNGKGATIGEVFYDQRKTLTLDVIPTGTNISTAGDAMIIPAPGTIVTVSDSIDDDVDATHGGKYILVRARKARSNTDVAKLTFELKQYVENDVAAVVAAGP